MGSIGIASEAQVAPFGTAPLVGRDQELALLSGLWQRAIGERRPHLVTLLADPGLGKSRLTAEFEKMYCRGAMVLHGRCLPYGEAAGYWALSSALKEAVGISAECECAEGRDRLQQLISETVQPQTESELAEVMRHLALLTGLDSESDRAGGPADQRMLHASVRRFLEALARKQPLCWIIEDIQWADDALLDLIEFVAVRAKDVPMLILTQARPGLLERRPRWGTGVRAFTSLPLETLSPHDGRKLVLGLCGQRGLPDSVAAEVARGAGGNPLFAEEYVAMIAEGGDEAGVPSVIKVVIAARLDALPDAERLLIQYAAVFGKAFWLGGLRALFPEPNLAECVEKLEQKDLVRTQPHSQFRNEQEFVFKHDLIRDVAYETLPRAQRQTLHARVGRWIEQTAGEQVESYFDQIAHHYLKAGEEKEAIEYLVRSAQVAHRLGAHRREAALLAQGIELASGQGQTALLAELQARRGTAFARVAAFADARQEMETALKEMPPEQVERRAEILVDLCSACFYGIDIPRMRQCAAEALALSDQAGRDDLAAEALGWLGAAAQADGDLLPSMDFHRRAKARAGTRPTLARSHVSLTLYLLGQNHEAAETGYEALEQVRFLNHTSGTLYSLSHLGLALAGSGRYTEALKIFEQARHFGREHETWSFLARATAMSAGFHLDVYDFAGNEALAEEARELARFVNFAPPVVSAGIDLVLNFARRHEISRAQSQMQEVIQAMQTVGGWHLWLWGIRLAEAQAELALAQHQWTEAIARADEAIAQSRLRHRVKYELLGLWTRARAFRGMGREKQAIGDLKAALEKARPVRDPAMILRLGGALLPVEGNETLALETTRTLQQMRCALPDGEIRRAFELGEPVCLVGKMGVPQP